MTILIRYLVCAVLAFGTLTTAATVSDLCLSSYKITIETRSRFDFIEQHNSLHRLSGFISLKPFAWKSNVRTDTGQWWAVKLTETSQTLNYQSLSTDPALMTPFAVLRGLDGTLNHYRFPPDTPEKIKEQLKGMIHYLQFPISSTREVERVESDSIGQYRTLFSFDGSQPSLVTKQKLHYENLSNIKQNSLQKAIESSHVEHSEYSIIRNQCWFSSVNGTERLHLKNSDNSYSLFTQQKTTIAQIDTFKSQWLLNMPATITSIDWHHDQAQPLTADALALLRAKLEKQLMMLDITAKRGIELGNWLKQYAPVIDVVGEMIIQNKFSDQHTKRIFNALGQMDQEGSNLLLISLMQNPDLNDENKFRAIRAITYGTSPLTLSVSDALDGILNNFETLPEHDLSSAAVMAVGSVLQRRSDNEHSAKLFNGIIAKAESASTATQRAALMASLGNTNNPEALPTLSQFSTDNHSQVRSNVAASLGQIATDNARDLLVDMFKVEQDSSCQRAIVSAFSHVTISKDVIAQVSKLAQSSKRAGLRHKAIQAIAAQSQHKDMIQIELHTLMKNESNRRNFSAAAAALTELNRKN